MKDKPEWLRNNTLMRKCSLTSFPPVNVNVEMLALSSWLACSLQCLSNTPTALWHRMQNSCCSNVWAWNYDFTTWRVQHNTSINGPCNRFLLHLQCFTQELQKYTISIWTMNQTTVTSRGNSVTSAIFCPARGSVPAVLQREKKCAPSPILHYDKSSRAAVPLAHHSILPGKRTLSWGIWTWKRCAIGRL